MLLAGLEETQTQGVRVQEAQIVTQGQEQIAASRACTYTGSVRFKRPRYSYKDKSRLLLAGLAETETWEGRIQKTQIVIQGQEQIAAVRNK